MWSRANLLLILVRLYFALSPSYIHPDENFQGPEVIAGKHSLVIDFVGIFKAKLEASSALNKSSIVA